MTLVTLFNIKVTDIKGSLKSLEDYQSGIWEVNGKWERKKEWKKKGKNIFLPIKYAIQKESGSNHSSSRLELKE